MKLSINKQFFDLVWKIYKLKVDSGTGEYDTIEDGFGGIELDVTKTMDESIKEAKVFLHKMDNAMGDEE